MNLNNFTSAVNSMYTLKRVNSSQGKASQVWKYQAQLPLQLQYKIL